MKSMYARFVLFLIRPALDRWAATEAATAIQVTTDCSGVGYVAGASLLKSAADQAEAAQEAAGELSKRIEATKARLDENVFIRSGGEFLPGSCRE